MKSYLIIVCIILGLNQTTLKAQVGAPTNNPNINAIIDLNNASGDATKGLALPRVALSSTTSASPLSAHVSGMIVYNTVTSGTGTTQVTEGIYTNNGSQWIRIFGSAPLSWSLTGNNNVNALNFIGTTDNIDFVTRTNNIERLRITSSGKLLINTTTVPTGGTNAKLIINNGTVNGGLMIKDGTQGLNKVFTADANGLGSWITPILNLSTFIPNKGSANIRSTMNTSTSWTYTNNVITVPPGKWFLKINFNCQTFDWLNSNETWWLRAIFSSSATTMTQSPDVISGSPYISGLITAGAHSFNLMGSLVIQNTTSANKSYYLWAGYLTNNNASSANFILSVGSNPGIFSNYIVLEKIN